ncbi:hypothetical protein PR202_ga17972 [Eleusine coracana subsp. coracana]|uniref:Uncharacterized protein n=1 Tax=Eleusine coracana subsp. coracana TaxID=191504 RepID=A0AAV5CQH4_ELECO|nr:hypothetical protein PR202_ga17972 [Eleusine coracana subsp. coracana]
MLTVVPGLSAMKNPVESFFSSGDGSTNTPRDPSSTTAGYLTRPPLIEEIMVPSVVSELANIRGQVRPHHGRPLHHRVHAKTVTFHLPVVTLDSNTEIVLRATWWHTRRRRRQARSC